MTYITVGTCPVCGSAEVEKKTASAWPFLDVEIAPGLSVRAPMWATYALCEECGLWYQDERLDDEGLKIFYSSGAYRRSLGISDEVMDKDELARAKYDAPLVREYFDNCDKHLDIGCSRGYFLHEVGARVQMGVEPDYKRIAHPDILYVTNLSLINTKFDIVSSLHNLEHVPDPMAHLRAMKECLAPGGILVIEVPSNKSPGGPFRFAHLYHFEPPVLRRMLEMVGMVIERSFSTPHTLVIARRKEEYQALTLADIQKAMVGSVAA